MASGIRSIVGRSDLRSHDSGSDGRWPRSTQPIIVASGSDATMPIVHLRFETLAEAAANTIDRLGHRFPLGQADRFRRFLPLLEAFGVFPPHVVDRQPLPESMVEVEEIVHFLERGPVLLTDG